MRSLQEGWAQVEPPLGVRCRLNGFRDGDAEVGEEAAVVGLHPFLGQSPIIVVPEGADDFPFQVLAGGFDGADGRIGEDAGEDAGEVAGERGARGEEVAVGDDLLADESQVVEGPAQRGEVGAELLEAQVGPGPWKT